MFCGRQEQILREEAYRDYLTDLLNRRGLYAVCQSLRQDDAPLALFLFDLDNLKKVNDQLGHDCGDQRIRQLQPSAALTFPSERYLRPIRGRMSLLWS